MVTQSILLARQQNLTDSMEAEIKEKSRSGTRWEDPNHSVSASSFNITFLSEHLSNMYGAMDGNVTKFEPFMASDATKSDGSYNAAATLPNGTFASDDVFKPTFTFDSRDYLPEEFSRSYKCLFIIAYVVIILLAVIGNALVIVIISANVKMRTVTNTFLVSLAVSDLLIAVLNMPIQLMFYVQNEWTIGEFMCKFSKYMQGVVIVATIFTLTGVAIDRYYAICNPLRARHVHTIRRAAILITIFWVASFLLVLPQIFIQRTEPVFDKDPPTKMVRVCVEFFSDKRFNYAYTLSFYFILYLAPVITMFGTYGKIAYTLWIRGPIGETPENPRDSERRLREKKRIVGMLVVIVVLFAVSWFPFFTRQVYLIFQEDAHHAPHSVRVLIALIQLFGYSNCCINPIIYCFLNESFQQHFFRTVCCSCFWRCLHKSRRGSSAQEFDRINPGHSLSMTRQSTLGHNNTTAYSHVTSQMPLVHQ